MQICKNCGGNLRYIALSKNNVIECDYEPTVVYTQGGRKVEGYQEHKCKDKPEDEKSQKL